MVEVVEDRERLLTLREAGERLGLSYWTVRDKLVRTGLLPAVNAYGVAPANRKGVRIRESDFLGYVASLEEL